MMNEIFGYMRLLIPTALLVLSAGAPVAVLGNPPAEPEDPAVADTLVAGPTPPPVKRGSLYERAIAGRLEVLYPGVEQRWLETETGPFLTIHRPASLPVPFGGLIVNSAPGTVVDGAPVLRRIAEAAAAGGWSVLSVQQVALGDPPAAAAARLDAARANFIAAGITNVVIVSDARGTGAALASMAADNSAAVVGLVGLGAWIGDPHGLEVSILDIAGTRDPAAMTAQRIRRAAAREYSKPVESIQIDGADRGFYGYEDEVAARVRGWLKRATPSIALRR